MTLPNVIILGAMKAGTTSLHDWLCRSPEVVPSTKKEIQYFSWNFNEGQDWYEEQFFQVSGKTINIDASPCYLYHPLAAQRIRDTIPDVKLIALLRDPVERAYSQYQHFKKYDTTTVGTFEDELALEGKYWREAYERILQMKAGGRDRAFGKWSYRARSRYNEQLYRYQNLFSENQILVLSDWREAIRVPAFLGIDPIEAPFPHSNKNSYPPMNNNTREFLKEQLYERSYSL